MTGTTRFGQRTGTGDAASFRCAACGETAAVVKAVPAGTPADMGPPLGPQSYDGAGIVVDYFGGTAWKLAGPATYAKVRTILAAEAPDPAELRRVDWELALFYCPDCGQNYCRADWHTYVLLDDGFYDCTMGTCPHGHQHMVEDLPAVAPAGPRHRLLGLRWRFCRHGVVLSAPRVTFRASAARALR